MLSAFNGFLTDIGIDRRIILWFASPVAVERYENCEEGNLKLCYEKIMIAQAIRNFREFIFFQKKKEQEFDLDEYIQSKCKEYCKGNFEISDEFGKSFVYTCEKIHSSYCKLSEFNREVLQLKSNTIEAFKPRDIPFEYNVANIKGIDASIKGKFEKYLKDVLVNGITIYGSLGNGKTCLFYLIIKELLLKRNSDGGLEIPFFITISDFFTAVVKDNAEVVKKLLDTKYLLIDDLGSEYKNEWGSSQFDNIVCNRFTEGKLTSFNTNLNDDQFKKNYPRIYDRQRKTNKVLTLIGPSMRGQK
jgi:DNA replication protein DnaC